MEQRNAASKQDVYQRVTDQIIAAIENGVGKWKMPWHSTGAMAPANVTSKHPYRGINTLCLMAAAAAKGYDSGEWGTYKQWKTKGAQVRKGEKATLIVLWKFADTKTKDEAEDSEEVQSRSRLLFVRGYSVFNAAQVDGYEAPERIEKEPNEHIAEADEFFSATGAPVQHGGGRACYSEMLDEITMPAFNDFNSNTDYYSTLAHEIVHWTSEASRCDRQLGKRFGDDAYAAEELIAELGAAFTCNHLGLSSEPREDHAQYIQHWLRVLKADKKAIFIAASKAQQACDWMQKRAAVKAVAA